MRHPWLLACLVVAAALPAAVLSAQTAADSVTTAPAPTTQPTDEDRALAARFEELKARLDGGVGTETINVVRDEKGQSALARLKGEAPATPPELEEARAAYRRTVGALENAAKLPEFPPYEVVRRRNAIRIDGRLEKAEWNDAHRVPLSYRFPQFEPASEKVPRAMLMWDDRNLYAAFIVPDEDLQAEPVRDDGTDTFLYDCVELFILPEPRFPAYWEINVTPLGEVMDRMIMKYPRRWFGDVTYFEDIEGLQKQLVVKGTVNDRGDRDEGYVVELAIPFDQLPGMKRGPRKGDSIRGLMAWGNVTGKLDYANQLYYSEIPTVNGYNDIWCFREWKFVGERRRD